MTPSFRVIKRGKDGKTCIFGQEKLNSSLKGLIAMRGRPVTEIEHLAPRGRRFGRGIVYCLPDDINARSPRGFLAWLDGKPFNKSARQAAMELRWRINEHAQQIHLPPAALVTDTSLDGDAVCTDPLSVLTVMSKSSENVYLRDKEPNLAALRYDRRVVVFVPETQPTDHGENHDKAGP